MRQPGQVAGDNRGRGATSPTEIPVQGWKDILWRTYEQIGEDRVTLIAAGVTYYLLLAFIPGLTSLVSLYGLFSDPAVVGEHLSTLQGIIPAGGLQILDEQLTRLTTARDTTLGFTFVISLAISLWSANAGVKSLFEAMNVAYNEREERSFIVLNAVSLTFTLGIVVTALIMIGLVVVLPAVLDLFYLGEGFEWLITLVSLAAAILVMSLGVAALYRWGPSRDSAQWQWITPGSILTLVLTAVVSILFSWYTANFGSYDATYGSLGAMIGFMTWIWLTMIILIVGAELNSEMEHQTARDTTTGTPRPLGRRDATMADSVAGVREAPKGGTGFNKGVDDEAGSGHSGRGRPLDSKGRERVSLGQLAVAVPAALILSWAKKRSARGSSH
ncbi:YihY/virulence factor BrkB family protein [Mangrovicella endophytica]|uniref:YihY/virulence factor BrkB family protein n=1 Tax=Mangrovicella endophytica TaxID=2066697 RepID=UPI000C9EB33C|nr:YihY/virulence factor BrkB family protein [Mangrovicella endophytica]